MKKTLLAAIAFASVLTAAAPVEAAQGCGPGGHRGPAGYCRPNGPYFAPGLRIGVFYPGRGYWDGHRYWVHRAWYRHGWRYYP
jgi:hypothetical protein